MMIFNKNYHTMKIHSPHLKIPYNGENKKQKKDKTKIMENQTVAIYKDTKAQHKNSFYKIQHITNYPHAPNVMVPTSLK